MESLTTDLSMERAAASKAESDRAAADRQVKELRARLQELETSVSTRAKAQMAALEQRNHNLEEQLNAETK